MAVSGIPVAELDDINGASTRSAEYWLDRYHTVRAWTETLCAPLATEDYVIQSMPDASPAKWHLAHTSWFFERFLLDPHLAGYNSPHPQYEFLFNSYYNSLGPRHCRPKRGLVSRPTVDETYSYRRHVDRSMAELLRGLSTEKLAEFAPIIELGLNHEQQHQELLVTDVKHMLSENPLMPVYRDLERNTQHVVNPGSMEWTRFDGGLYDIGYSGGDFCFDNETPRHPEYLQPFAIASRLVTNGEYLEFMRDGGYKRPEFWLSEGWATAQAQEWYAPMYWYPAEDFHQPGEWTQFTLHGLSEIDLNEPVTHISLFEADAYAHWAGKRLATEAEWEAASVSAPVNGPFAESEQFHPAPLSASGTGLQQMYGDVWQWTRSQYSPYPGYKQADGALGEYNGKFMCNQFVLRGGSCATPQSHIRPTYRNFFSPEIRWQFTGIRLAQDI